MDTIIYYLPTIGNLIILIIGITITEYTIWQRSKQKSINLE